MLGYKKTERKREETDRHKARARETKKGRQKIRMRIQCTTDIEIYLNRKRKSNIRGIYNIHFTLYTHSYGVCKEREKKQTDTERDRERQRQVDRRRQRSEGK